MRILSDCERAAASELVALATMLMFGDEAAKATAAAVLQRLTAIVHEGSDLYSLPDLAIERAAELGRRLRPKPQ